MFMHQNQFNPFIINFSLKSFHIWVVISQFDQWLASTPFDLDEIWSEVLFRHITKIRERKKLKKFFYESY